MIKIKGQKRGLVVASNRLPFYRYIDKRGKSKWGKSTGGLITALEPILSDTEGIWVGGDGLPVERLTKRSFKLIDSNKINPHRESVSKSYRVAVVPLNHKEFGEYYNKFSNGTLWALFHYFFEKSSINYAAWNSYMEINRRFAQYIDQISAKDDILWVQDFHLFLVPYYLRELRPNGQIHFFLHIPFPHLDIFSILPWQRFILESLMCCDTVGFHHKQYMHNFMGAVDNYRKEKRASGDETMEDSIKTRIYANPISIDFEHIDKTSRKDSVIAKKDEIIKQAGCPKLIVGVDRIDYSKGIKERLLGLEYLLDGHPELKEKFFYYQLVVPSREDVSAYRDLKKEIDEIIGRINGRFSKGLWTPVYYNYGTMPFEDLIALYSASDVALVTPLRDGMNLVCKEYVAAHSDGDGVLVLSKFAGAIAEIKNCIPVNPYSIEDIASAIYRALNMPEKERRDKMKKMRRNIRDHNITTWLGKCFEQFNK